MRPVAAMNRQAPRLSVGVFCGARHGAADHVVRTATEFGAALGARRHRLVYGGGGSGLMGVVAWAAHRQGSEVVGVIPHFLYERERGIEAPPQHLCLTDTMGERKQEMISRSDGFVALAGGLGTIDEIFEVLSLGCLGLHDKPLVLLDPAGLWDNLVALTREVAGAGFADLVDERALVLVRSVPAALHVLESRAVSGTPAPEVLHADAHA